MKSARLKVSNAFCKINSHDLSVVLRHDTWASARTKIYWQVDRSTNVRIRIRL